MLKNNLKPWEDKFEQGQTQLAGIDLSRRGETLSISDFANMANHLHSKNE
jgi:16S rRNA A1518/A1519 N6-dimethyltransferase RsmA/KsgA/DIM1 with predicted DNA glycosylase/AP lyase activity